MATATEKLDSEPLLERSYVRGDIWLPDEERTGCAGEAPVLRDGMEAAQLVKVDLQGTVEIQVDCPVEG